MVYPHAIYIDLHACIRGTVLPPNTAAAVEKVYLTLNTSKQVTSCSEKCRVSIIIIHRSVDICTIASPPGSHRAIMLCETYVVLHDSNSI